MSEKKELINEELEKVIGGKKDYHHPESVICQHCQTNAPCTAKSWKVSEYECPNCHYMTHYEKGQFIFCISPEDYDILARSI